MYEIYTNLTVMTLLNLNHFLIITQAEQIFFSIVTHFVIAYHISLRKYQTNYCINNLLILDVKQLNKIRKLYYFHTSKALWDGQGKIKMYYRMSRVKKLLLEKSSIMSKRNICKSKFHVCYHFLDMKILGEKSLLTCPVQSIIK